MRPIACSNRDRYEYEQNREFRFQQYSSGGNTAASRLRSPVTAGIVPGPLLLRLAGERRTGFFLCLRGHSGQTGAALNPETASGHSGAGTCAGRLRLLNLRETLSDGTSLPSAVLDGFPLRLCSLSSRGKGKGEARGIRRGDKTKPTPRSGRACELHREHNVNINYLLARRTYGANPSKIWTYIDNGIDDAKLAWLIKRMPYQEFLQTAYWFAVSTKRKSDMGMRCQVCNEAGELHVHHRTYESHGEEHYNLRDLCVLCKFCHGLFHGHIPPTPKRFYDGPKNGRIRLKKGTIVPHTDSDISVPDGDRIILTRELIDACRANGSFTNATIRAFGLTRATMTRGWTFRLIGKEMTREEYKQAQEGRFHYNSGRIPDATPD